MNKCRIGLGFVITISAAMLLFSSCQRTKYTTYDPMPIPSYHIDGEKIRLALVLGSGGSRGIAHLGVLSVFEENNIPIDLIVGTSAGSVIAALYADQQSVMKIVPKLQVKNKKMLLDMDMLNLRYGIYKGIAFKQFLGASLEAKTFEELKIPCIVVATDLVSGEEIAFGSGELVPVLHASCALPYFFHPVEIYGRVFVDGGVTNPIPVSVAKRQNPKMIVAVDITQALPKELPTNLLGVARRSMEICFQKINGMCMEDADIIIIPDVKHIDTFEDQSFSQLFEAGRVAAQAAIPAIKKQLNSLHQKKMIHITD
ncbi:MAG: patatin-like phospholipase family protein [Rhabdochlamydiaceae bacterium]|nr:patatin-like phospholipase family protein [Candidatus Amphrikana amoebophyrae]